MTLVARSARAHLDGSTGIFNPPICGDYEAGEDLDACAPCYGAADGKIYMADGTAANLKAKVLGWTPKAYKAGDAGVTLHQGVGQIYGNYVSGTPLTPHVVLYLGATKGRLDTGTTTGDAVGVAQVLRDGISIRATRLI